MEPWTQKRILILGMTYPSYSQKYVWLRSLGNRHIETRIGPRAPITLMSQ